MKSIIEFFRCPSIELAIELQMHCSSQHNLVLAAMHAWWLICERRYGLGYVSAPAGCSVRLDAVLTARGPLVLPASAASCSSRSMPPIRCQQAARAHQKEQHWQHRRCDSPRAYNELLLTSLTRSGSTPFPLAVAIGSGFAIEEAKGRQRKASSRNHVDPSTETTREISSTTQ